MKNISRDLVFAGLDEERDYQDKKWGVKSNAPVAYIAYMHDHILEALRRIARATNPDEVDRALCSVRKVTALGVACLEEHGIVTRAQEAHMDKAE